MSEESPLVILFLRNHFVYAISVYNPGGRWIGSAKEDEMSEATDQVYVRLGESWHSVPAEVFGQETFKVNCGDISGVVHVAEDAWHSVEVECRTGDLHMIAPAATLEPASVNGEAVEMRALAIEDYDEGILINVLDTAAMFVGQ